MALPEEWFQPKKKSNPSELSGFLFRSQPARPSAQKNLANILAEIGKPPTLGAPGKTLANIGGASQVPSTLVRRPRVFVSFDYENDGYYKKLLEAWNANSKFKFTFQDKTPIEIQTDSVSVIKAVLTRKVREATHVLVLAGAYANQPHKDRKEIGLLNWLHFEANQAMFYKKKIVVVYLKHGNNPPKNLLGYPGIEVVGFSRDGIIDALNRA